MKKISIIVFVSSLAIIFSAVFGWMIYEVAKLNELEKKEQIAVTQDTIEDECTEFVEREENVIQTMASEDKISPNAIIILKTYYIDCEHTTQENMKIPVELVNLSRKELQEYYRGWELKGFSNNEIVLYKEVDGFCDEHYKLKSKDGNVSIYKLKGNGEEAWEADTDINIEFLPEEDREKIKNGLNIIGKENLNKTIEDFE